LREGSHTVCVPTPRPIILTAALAAHRARIRHIPRLLRAALSLSLETTIRGVAHSTPGVEAGPHVFAYQFSAFSS